jgi:hypothetical protein
MIKIILLSVKNHLKIKITKLFLNRDFIKQIF